MLVNIETVAPASYSSSKAACTCTCSSRVGLTWVDDSYIFQQHELLAGDGTLLVSFCGLLRTDSARGFQQCKGICLLVYVDLVTCILYVVKISCHRNHSAARR